MSDYIIETHDLTKRYGNQISVSHLNIHAVSYTHLTLPTIA